MQINVALGILGNCYRIVYRDRTLSPHPAVQEYE
jgi:hypothetical protein